MDVRTFFDPYGPVQKHGSKLPHWQQEDSLLFVTFRLNDSLPDDRLREWKGEKRRWYERHPKPWTADVWTEYHDRFTMQVERWLDAGAGSCLLKDPVNRRAVKETLMQSHGKAVHHHSWIIMPNHVHLLFVPLRPLPELIKAWKRVSAQSIGAGSIWQAGYYDTLIRSETHYFRVVWYIRNNPASLMRDHYTLWECESVSRIP